jgi:hypothetical protein
LPQYQTSNENAPPTKFLPSYRLLPRYIYPVFGRHGIPLPFPSPKRRICHGQTSVRPSQLSSTITQLAFRTSSRTRLPCAARPQAVYPAPPTPSRLPCTAHPPPSQDPSTLDRPPTALPGTRLPWTAHHRPPPPTNPSTLYRPPKAVYPVPPTHRPPPNPSTLDRSPTGLPGPVYPGPPSVPSTQVPPEPSTLDRPPTGQVHLSRAVYPGPPARQGRKGGTVSGRPRSPRLRHPTFSFPVHLSSPRKARRQCAGGLSLGNLGEEGLTLSRS